MSVSNCTWKFLYHSTLAIHKNLPHYILVQFKCFIPILSLQCSLANLNSKVIVICIMFAIKYISEINIILKAIDAFFENKSNLIFCCIVVKLQMAHTALFSSTYSTAAPTMNAIGNATFPTSLSSQLHQTFSHQTYHKNYLSWKTQFLPLLNCH